MYVSLAVCWSDHNFMGHYTQTDNVCPGVFGERAVSTIMVKEFDLRGR
jgi:hypothetical protein